MSLINQIFGGYNFFVASIVLGVICILWVITAAYLGYIFWVNFKGDRVTGRLVGYGRKSPSDPCLFPVIEFTDRTGQTHRAWSDEGSSAYNLKAIDQKVSVSYLGSGESNVHLHGEIGNFIIPLVLLVISVGAFLIANANFHFHPVHYIAAAVFVAGTFWRIHLIQGIFKAVTTPGWKAQPVSAINPPVSLVPVEELRAGQTAQVQTAQLQKTPWPLFIVIALICFGFACVTAQRQFLLQQNGQRAEGHIIDYKKQLDSHNHASYHAVVRFAPAANTSVVFIDGLGTSWHHNDFSTVTVLYDPAHPGKAMIDRGLWNWLLPVVLAAIGLLFATIALKARAALASLRPKFN